MRQVRLLYCLLSIVLFTPMLSAQQYDIYVMDVKKGTQEKIANGLIGDMYNAAWSNNRNKLAYDVTQPFGQSIFITNLQTSITAPLIGAEDGNDAAWSPNGETIAFDAWEDYYQVNWWIQNIYTVPATGGVRTLVRSNAHHASWNPSGNIVAFDDNSGYIGTRDINTGNETFVAGIGDRPSWSPNGQYIAFDGAAWAGGGIWIVKVDTLGYPMDWPVQITTSGYGPTWKNNSKEIVFIDWPDGDPNLYSIPITGGTATKIGGRVGGFDKGDYDPAYSNDGQFIAWSSFTDVIISPVTQINTQKPHTGVAPLSKNRYALEQNYPNPFRYETKISFNIAEATPVELDIYNITGQKIHTLVNANYVEGNYTVSWNGRDKNGNLLPAAIYIYHLRTKNAVLVGRMVKN